jgi:hypothetical protein
MTIIITIIIIFALQERRRRHNDVFTSRQNDDLRERIRCEKNNISNVLLAFTVAPVHSSWGIVSVFYSFWSLRRGWKSKREIDTRRVVSVFTPAFVAEVSTSAQ